MSNSVKSDEFVPASREQLPDLAVFLDECWKAEYQGILDQELLDSLSPLERAEALLKQFDSQELESLVAIEAGSIVGVVIFGESITDGYPDDGEVRAIYLEPGHIGTGLGSRLLIAAESCLLERGYRSLVIDAFAMNHRAIAFYRKHGYQQVSETDIEFGGKSYPVVVMRKDVVQ
jgi:ribosomal protein S18 acetylase RimI-like enzyme